MKPVRYRFGHHIRFRACEDNVVSAGLVLTNCVCFLLRWFCHVDDDTYLNVPALVTLVRQYNHTGDWYLGKPSLNHPVEKQDINDRRVSLFVVCCCFTS